MSAIFRTYIVYRANMSFFLEPNLLHVAWHTDGSAWCNWLPVNQRKYNSTLSVDHSGVDHVQMDARKKSNFGVSL